MSALFSAADGARLAEIVNEVADGAEYVLCREGKAVAVVVPFERFEELRRAAASIRDNQ